MIALGLQVFDAPLPGGRLLYDWTGSARGVEFETTENGFGRLSAFVDMGLKAAFELYSLRVVPHVVLSAGGEVVYDGRLEDISILTQGVRVTAFGYWRSFSDMPYTALWSDRSYERWYIDAGNGKPSVWQTDKYNRLYAAPRKNEVFDSVTAVIAWRYDIPDDSQRNLSNLSFDYVLDGVTGWKARVAAGGDTSGDLWSLASNGTAQSGSASVTVGGDSSVLIFFYYDNVTPAAYTGETGDVYLRLTNIRVTTAAPAITADEIIDDIITQINLLNGQQVTLSESIDPGWITRLGVHGVPRAAFSWPTSAPVIKQVGLVARLQNPGVDLDDALYEDVWPAAIMNELARAGDNQTPPRLWEIGVWENRRVVFQPRGDSGRVWYVDVADIEVERSLASLRNAVYATYDGDNGRRVRTAVGTDADSVQRYGITRRAFVSASTSGQAVATTLRDVYLDDSAEIRPRARVLTSGLFDSYGAEWPRWMARSGDTLVLRNLPPSWGELDNLRSFRIARTTYRCDDDVLIPVPEQEVPEVDVLIAGGGG